MKQFKLLKSSNQSSWDTIYTFNTSANNFTYDDYVRMDNEVAYYKVIAQDLCNQYVSSNQDVKLVSC